MQETVLHITTNRAVLKSKHDLVVAVWQTAMVHSFARNIDLQFLFSKTFILSYNHSHHYAYILTPIAIKTSISCAVTVTHPQYSTHSLIHCKSQMKTWTEILTSSFFFLSTIRLLHLNSFVLFLLFKHKIY